MPLEPPLHSRASRCERSLADTQADNYWTVRTEKFCLPGPSIKAAIVPLTKTWFAGVMLEVFKTIVIHKGW